MAAKARAENDRLNDRLKALEDRLAEMTDESGPKKPTPSARKAADKPVQGKPASGKTSANKATGTRSTDPKTD
jgi:cell division septum initiation protein DivIVA